MKLNPRQLRFVAEYLVDLNAHQAAVRAGYSPRTAMQIGSALLKKPHVAAAVAAGKAKQLDRLEISADRVLAEAMRLAFADLGQAFDEDGKLLPLSEMPEDVRRALSGVELVEMPGDTGAQLRKVKLWDKPKSLELLMRHLGLLKDKVELSLSAETLEQLVSGARAAGGSK